MIKRLKNREVTTLINSGDNYTANDIEILEGLEPVRVRPGMYIGGTDNNAMHHLVTEILDNAMDEVVAGFATKITVLLSQDLSITITDNGRGIPVDHHAKFPNKSVLEVILTTLHSGGKFTGKVYSTAGGLHGVGISVVNALSEKFEVKVFRSGVMYCQEYIRGVPQGNLSKIESNKNARGTSIKFTPDRKIFGNDISWECKKIYNLVKSKAYLYKGIKIQWNCDYNLIGNDKLPTESLMYFPGGLKEYLDSKLDRTDIIGEKIFSGVVDLKSNNIKVEWAICWHKNIRFIESYCNTIPTPSGGTHEKGLRAALLFSVRSYCDSTGYKQSAQIVIDDILENAAIVLSIFIENPMFQGQTKEKLVSGGISKYIENAIKDHFDHWITEDKNISDKVIDCIVSNAEYRLSRKNIRSINRKTFTDKIRLPGKLADCTSNSAIGTELFLVEGDSAGGSAKQARDRETQAILPLRGKILNVVNATEDKICANQEIRDLEIALACGSLTHFKKDKLRYEKVIIMTDADVDGAHIAALLLTFFYIRMRPLIEAGHLYIACPPLYRLVQNNKIHYAIDDKQKNVILDKLSKSSKSKIDVGRFKGLGEMTPQQLKATTMEPSNRILYRVKIEDLIKDSSIVDDLMGKSPEKRFAFIKSNSLKKSFF